jgi:hypothetical protein
MAEFADDPWGVAMWACAALAGVGVLWALVALAMRQPARAAGRLLGFGAFGYLATAAASVALRVGASASSPVADADAGAGTSATDGASARVSVGDAKSDAKSEEKAGGEPAVTIDPGITGPPQRGGPEALRFASQIANDERCKDARAIAGAVRDLAAAVASEPKRSVDKAVDKLEGCRKKIVWVKAASVRRKRVDAREAWVESLKTRMKSEGTPVFVSLRGAAHERIRLGGSPEAIGKLRGQYDATLKQELEGLGFTEVTFANMKDTERFELAVPNDHELAARELASLKLDTPIRVP